MPNGSSGWPSLYAVSGTRDAVTALLAIPDLLFEDHGQFVQDDGTSRSPRTQRMRPLPPRRPRNRR